MKKLLTFTRILLFVIGLSLTILAEELSAPEKNFEYLWKKYTTNCAIFKERRVDWIALYAIYRPQVTPETTDDELFKILSTMLGHLNNNHISLRTEKAGRYFNAGILNTFISELGGFAAYEKIMAQRPVPEKYFKKKLVENENKIFGYGWLTEDIGYFHFKLFTDIEKSTEAIDTIILKFKDAKAIIVDVRKNRGGDDRVGKLIADRFADRKRLYMTTQIRRVSSPNNLSEKRYWYVEPNGPIQFKKTVILLVDRTSISAGDNFALAMRVIPHVTLVGDFTSGCFSDIYFDQLPNGWNFTVPFKLVLDPAGFCWEGIGVIPDIMQSNSKENYNKGIDEVLHLAITLINSGTLKLQEEKESLKNIRTSLAEDLQKNIEEKGIDKAIKTFKQAKTGDKSSYYIEYEELWLAGRQFVKSGKLKEGIEVFKINTQEFPGIMTYYSLGYAYLRNGEMDLAWEQYKKALSFDNKQYPWEINAYYKMLLEEILYKKGFKAFSKKYNEIQENNLDEITENLLSWLGNDLLENNKTKDAINVLKLNTEMYPKHTKSFIELGDAYIKNENKKLSLKSYKKALELDPENETAKAKLEELNKK